MRPSSHLSRSGFVVSQGVPVAWEVHTPEAWSPGDPTALVMVGWGTYAHGSFDQVPWRVADRRRVILLDWRGIGDSGDDPSIPATTRAHAVDAAAVLDAVADGPVHVVGIVGIGACVAQWLAVDRPDLVRCLALSGGWVAPDRLFVDQMTTLLDVARTQGFLPFQRLCAQWCFDPDYYGRNADRFLGPHGPWSHLDGHPEAMERLVRATVQHDARAVVAAIDRPTLVIHAEHDLLTGPRLTGPLAAEIPGATSVRLPLPHVVAGPGPKKAFSDALGDFLDAVEAGQ
jgi:pimeloyl-ACP methyl ester carboxylesterase